MRFGAVVNAAAVAVLLLPAVARAQVADTTAADVVTLTFAWPEGMVAGVDLQRTRVRSRAGSQDTSAVHVTYNLAVLAHPDGKLIRYTDFAAPGLAGMSEPQLQVLQAVSSIVPSYVISAEGELLRIDQLAEVRERMLGWMRQAVDPAATGGLGEMLSGMLSEEALFAAAAQEWNALVGSWIGAELEVGSTYEIEGEEQVPLLGNVAVPYRHELGASGRVPCRAGETQARCVELILRSYPDPQKLQPHLEAFLQRLMEAAGVSGTLPPISYKQFEIENEIVVVAEPATLVPHELTIVRSVTAVMDVGGREQGGSDFQVARYIYSYR
jgi:hypothetical protein